MQAERIWDDIVKKLQQKEYNYDAGTYGSLEEFEKKVAYFYHASIQGAGAYPGAADALRMVAERGIAQGLSRMGSVLRWVSFSGASAAGSGLRSGGGDSLDFAGSIVR